MLSNYPTFNKAVKVLTERKKLLLDKKVHLKERIDERWPYDAYGIKGYLLYEERSEAINKELKLLDLYLQGMSDLVEIIETKAT